jgi:MFS transporter, FSR family, fosmidomycin resistance protein
MKKQSFQPAKVLTISLAHTSHDIFSSFLAPLLPLLIDKLELSLSMSAFLDIIRRIPALFNPFLGLMVENKGGKYFVILTPAVTAISMGLIGVASSATVLLILLFVAGISAALFHVPTPVMVKEVSGDKVGTGMSFYMVGGELARTVGPLLVISTVSIWSLEEIYRLIPIGLFASFILFLKFRNYEVQEPVYREKIKGESLNVLMSNAGFFLLMSGFFLFHSASKSALTLYLPVYLIERGASLWYAGLSLSILQFFGVLGTFCGGNLSDRIGRRQTLIISSIAFVTSMGLFVWTQNMVFLSFLGFFLFSSAPILLAATQEIETRMPTFMNSMFMFINFGISSLMVLVVGLLGDGIGLEMTYKVCAILSIVAIPMACLIKVTPVKNRGMG